MNILSVNTAAAAPRLIQGRSVVTAIGKQPVAGAVAVGPLGLAGDEQADLVHHALVGVTVAAVDVGMVEAGHTQIEVALDPGQALLCGPTPFGQSPGAGDDR